MSNSPQQFSYQFKGQKIIYPSRLKSRQDLYCLLHEQGHKSCSHKYLGGGRIDFRDVIVECEAWAYAYRCVRTQYHEEFLKFAVSCVQTYNELSEAVYGEFLYEDEIIKLITERR